MGSMVLHAGAPRTLAASTVPVQKTEVPMAVAHSATMTMANPAALYLRNPVFGGWALGRPQPRNCFSPPVLISPDATPNDRTQFEDPADPTKKHYLPRYSLATVGSGGAQTYAVSFAANADGFVLTVQLADATDPATVSAAIRIDAATRYILTANLAGLSATWDFGNATSDGSNLTLSLTVTDPATRDSIYRAMTDPSAHAQLIVRHSLQLAVPEPAPANAASETLYRESMTAIDSPIAFTFDPALDKSVFALLGSVGSGQSTWVVTHVPYAADNRSFPYYQDPRQPSLVYYLPDTFQISRQQAAPHAPNITIATSGSDPSTLSFTLSFLAIPIWNPERIANAAAWWQQYLHASAPPAMQLFEASNTSLQLTLPAGDGTGSPSLTTLSSAIIDIAGGINCAVTLSLAQLQEVYAALFDQVSQLLSGVVTVTADSDVESIHFSWRATDFAGTVLDATTTFDPAKGEFNVVVANSIESPVHVDSLPASIVGQASTPPTGHTPPAVPSLGNTATPPLPVDLVPATASATGPNSVTLGLRMVPQDLGGLGSLVGQALGLPSNIPGPPGSPQYEVIVDYGHISVKPDASAIWDAIMSNQVVGPVQRGVKVIAFASMFAAGGSAPVMAAHVVFQNGQTVDFDASTPADSAGTMTQIVQLAVPVKTYVLGSGDTSTYQYRVDLVTAGGTQQGQWTTSNADSFYVQTSG